MSTYAEPPLGTMRYSLAPQAAPPEHVKLEAHAYPFVPGSAR